MGRKIIVAVTGASGSVYASQLFEKIGKGDNQPDEVAVIFSENALDIWKYELKREFRPSPPFRIYATNDFYAPFASGSSSFDTMIICPCSMGTLGKIAGGISNDLITRAADVILKERRKLILVPRETPYNLIHLENMRAVSLAGGIICPASPSFYSEPVTIEQLTVTVVDRVMQLAGLDPAMFRWGEKGY